MICTFFGHKDTSQLIKLKLYPVLIDLIENKGVNLFYVGNNGNFDVIVRNTLEKLERNYPHIRYYVVLAYMPNKNDFKNNIDYSKTIYPDGLEKTPLKYAISKRNEWMVNKSDFVVTNVVRNFGGAAKFKRLAERKDKKVINIE